MAEGTGAVPADAGRSASSPPPSEAPGRTIPDAQYDRLSADQQARFARVRDGNNDSVWTARSDGLSGRDAQADGQGDQARRDGEPSSDRIRIGGIETSEAELRQWMTEKSEWDLRKSSLPASPDHYTATLPADLRLPVEVRIDEASPILADARRAAHSMGLSQEQFSSLLGIYATDLSRQQQRIDQAKAAEVAKLGTNGASRVANIEMWVRGMLGDSDARTLMLQGMYTAAGTAAFERLIGKVVSQGSGSYSRAHTEPPEQQGRVSDEQWDSMGPSQRLDYARSFDQSRVRR